LPPTQPTNLVSGTRFVTQKSGHEGAVSKAVTREHPARIAADPVVGLRG
jgi:hypothetical protein